TVVCPLLLVCVGVLAPTHDVTGLATPGAASPLSGTRPPAARPLGIEFGALAAARAALCAARIAWIACTARVIDCWLLCAACWACCAAAAAAAAAAAVADDPCDAAPIGRAETGPAASASTSKLAPVSSAARRAADPVRLVRFER